MYYIKIVASVVVYLLITVLCQTAYLECQRIRKFLVNCHKIQQYLCILRNIQVK
jgi:hypothetical protein